MLRNYIKVKNCWDSLQCRLCNAQCPVGKWHFADISSGWQVYASPNRKHQNGMERIRVNGGRVTTDWASWQGKSWSLPWVRISLYKCPLTSTTLYFGMVELKVQIGARVPCIPWTASLNPFFSAALVSVTKSPWIPVLLCTSFRELDTTKLKTPH